MEILLDGNCGRYKVFSVKSSYRVKVSFYFLKLQPTGSGVHICKFLNLCVSD